ncbi:YegP family protein [Haloarchaeobius sp. TZWWS8]|uniref:YegP family protein n=1 Tax=Haloarchaeobius sp. TZWWS8 TaxID=3446121 RepID=UPI003EBB4DB4
MASKFELYTDKRGEFRWRLRASNGQIIATAGEGFKSKANAKRNIETVKKAARRADVTEIAPMK